MNEKAIKRKSIYIISDGTGATAERMLRAALAQFGNQDTTGIERFGSIRTIPQIAEIIASVKKEEASLIVYTLVSPKLRREITTRAAEIGIEAIDLFGNLLVKLSELFHSPPKAKPGILSRLNDSYYKKLDSIGFAVKHDDGQRIDEIYKADLVLVGVSRTCKTPVSVYLAYYKGAMVANIPIIKNITLPSELFRIDQRKVVGLTIENEMLVKIRRVRAQKISRSISLDYSDPKSIREELQYSNLIFRQNPLWLIINVTSKGIEEIAAEIAAQRLYNF